MEKNWKDISYLSIGNEIQKKAYTAIKTLRIIEILEKFDPILVGTIPININTDKSDLDIICHFADFQNFTDYLFKHFGQCQGFKIENKNSEKGIIIISNFYFMNFEFEIYATTSPSHIQNGYRHMLIEDRILNILGEDFRLKVVALKEKGIKTEPAFAKLLKLEGNPYEELLKCFDYSDEEITNLYKK